MTVVRSPIYAAATRGSEAAFWDMRVTRALDVTIALVALIFFLPLMLVIAALVYATDPGPIFFAHRRIGKGGRHFRCFKFRSMAVNAEALLSDLLANDPVARAEWARDHKLKNDPRITTVGAFLRKSSLDELPQIFNVLCGDMALVGPRPIVDAEALRYGRYFAHYCSVRPGITGLWQVSGRNNVSYRRRVAFDVAYSRSRSALFDVKILAMTVPSVVMARGSY
jgi:exopolysaccharide production protein ExoY